jgi:hypothetical protein
VKGGERDISSWTLYTKKRKKERTKTEGLDAQLSTQEEVGRFSEKEGERSCL